MPTIKTIEDFIATVEANEHVDAVERFYSSNAAIKDNQSEIRGKERHIENEKSMLLKIRKMHSKCTRPYFVNSIFVVIKWQSRFEFKNDTFIEMEEMHTKN